MRVSLLASLATLAISAEAADAGLEACRAEADDARRLACYDREMERASPAPAPVELTAEERFGREGEMTREEADRKAKESRELGELGAKVSEIWSRSDGLMVITLDNGQVWRQNNPDSFFRLKAGDPVRILPGVMNSFLMSGPSKRSTRVSRVK